MHVFQNGVAGALVRIPLPYTQARTSDLAQLGLNQQQVIAMLQQARGWNDRHSRRSRRPLESLVETESVVTDSAHALGDSVEVQSGDSATLPTSVGGVSV